MKAKLTGVFNQSSSFFWYPPRDLVNERYIFNKDEKIRENVFPGNGLSYTKKSLDATVSTLRTSFFNNNFSQGNRFKAKF